MQNYNFLSSFSHSAGIGSRSQIFTLFYEEAKGEQQSMFSKHLTLKGGISLSSNSSQSNPGIERVISDAPVAQWTSVLDF